jgi:hypothetical protein
MAELLYQSVNVESFTDDRENRSGIVHLEDLQNIRNFQLEGSYSDHFRAEKNHNVYHYKPYDRGDVIWGDAVYEPFNEIVVRKFAQAMHLKVIEACSYASYSINDSFGVITKVTYENVLPECGGDAVNYNDRATVSMIESAFFSLLMYDPDWGEGKTDCYSCSYADNGKVEDIRRFDFSHSVVGAYGEGFVSRNEISYTDYKKKLVRGTALGLFLRRPDEVRKLIKRTKKHLTNKKIYRILQSSSREYNRILKQVGIQIKIDLNMVATLTGGMIKFRKYAVNFSDEMLIKYSIRK